MDRAAAPRAFEAHHEVIAEDEVPLVAVPDVDDGIRTRGRGGNPGR